MGYGLKTTRCLAAASPDLTLRPGAAPFRRGHGHWWPARPGGDVPGVETGLPERPDTAGRNVCQIQGGAPEDADFDRCPHQPSSFWNVAPGLTDCVREPSRHDGISDGRLVCNSHRFLSPIPAQECAAASFGCEHLVQRRMVDNPSKELSFVFQRN